MTVPGCLNLEWKDFVITTKKEHSMWKDNYKVKTLIPDFKNPIGKDHYIFKTPKGEVSMIRYNNFEQWTWEIYSSETLFKDVERYDTWNEARERIKQVLSPDLDW